MEQGPVLVISFNSQQILAVRNAKGEVIEGDTVSTQTQLTVSFSKTSISTICPPLFKLVGRFQRKKHCNCETLVTVKMRK